MMLNCEGPPNNEDRVGLKPSAFYNVHKNGTFRKKGVAKFSRNLVSAEIVLKLSKNSNLSHETDLVIYF